MLRSLAALTDRVSRSLPLFLLAFACVLAVAGAALWIYDSEILPQTGYPSFDAQMAVKTLTAQQVTEQAAHYNAPARHAAWVFYALDMLFPVGVAVVQSAMAAWGVRKLFPGRYDKIRPWLPLLYIFAPLDWLENAAYLAAINSGASISATTAQATVFFAQVKWIAIYSVMTTVVLLTAGGLIAFIAAFFRTRRHDT